MVDHQHWHDRWRENRIGFHETAVNSHLQNYLPGFDLPPGSKIFVPLCGKAVDMAWLAEQGYEVIGIEISRVALEAFFAEQALDYGLVNHITTSEELLIWAEKLAAKIMQNSPAAVGTAIEAVNAGFEDGENGFDAEITLFGKCFGTADFQEGTQAFLNKRKPKFTGS